MSKKPSLTSLLDRLERGSVEERAAAAQGLADARDDRAVAALLAALDGDPALAVRRAAARALATARPSSSASAQGLLDRAAGSLTAALSGPDHDLALASARSLGALGRQQAAQGLLSALAAVGLDDEVRRAAADALMRLEVWNVEGTVLAALRHQDAVVRCFTAGAAARYVREYDVRRPWRWPGWFEPEKSTIRVNVNLALQKVAEELARGAREDESESVRLAARVALAAIGETLAAKRLHGVVDEREDDDLMAEPSGEPEHDRPTRQEQDVARALRDADLAEEQRLAVSPEEPGRLGRALDRIRGPREQRAAAPPEEPGLLARAIGSLRLAMSRLEPAAEGPAPRYADLTLFEEPGGGRLPAGHALRRGAWYRLEVAVRARPSGVPAEGPRRPLREPRQRADVELDVTVEGDGFEVEQPVDFLVLPPAGDSTRQASFRVSPSVETSSAGLAAELRVRVYCRFNLLEEIVLRAAVVGRFDDPAHPPEGVRRPVGFRQVRLDRPYLDFDDVRPRVLNVHVSRRGERFAFRFTFEDRLQRKVELAAPVPLQLGDLEDLLAGVRRTWGEIAMSECFATGVEAGEDELVPMLRRLAQAGRELWVKLFLLESGGSMSRIVRWLTENPPEPGAIVQVSLGEGASSFVFPWALLYDRPLPRETYKLPDPEGFWGMRYEIEQQPPVRRPAGDPVAQPDPLRLEAAQWSQFRNTGLQNELLAELKRLARGHLEVGSIDDAGTCYRRLREGGCHLFYFYTHGYTRRRATETAADREVELLARQWERLPPGSPARAAWEELYRRLREPGETDRSWIELTYGKLYLDELYEQVSALDGGPVVILNLCESAQVSPMLADSFVHFFLDRGSRAVVGTECPMTIELAHPFSELLLRDILGGETVGAALLAARRHFMARRNPLALAYTLYGRATAAFDPAPLRAASLEERSDARPRRAGLARG